MSTRKKRLSAAQLASGLIISVGEARKLLGEKSKDYSDDELAYIILDMHELARELILNNIN